MNVLIKPLSVEHKKAISEGMLAKRSFKRKLVKITVILEDQNEINKLVRIIERSCNHKGVLVKVLE